jgi:uncharacterized protein
MADEKTNNASSTGDMSPLDRLMNSPSKLVVFCGAVLLLSLMSGMFIGGLVKDEKTGGKNISDTQLVPEVLSQPDTESQLSETESTIADDTVGRPVDALDYDSSKSAAYEENLPIDETDAPTSPEVASLPPTSVDAPEKPITLVPDNSATGWQKYAVAVPEVENVPLISIVIDDVGINKNRIKALSELSSPLTLAFLPYASGLQNSVDLIRSKGHEAMVHMPMEPTRKTADPGPNALLTSLSIAEIEKRTRENLNKFKGFVGVNNHMGSKFTEYEAGMAAFMNIAAGQGLLFLDSRTTAKSTGYSLAKQRGMLTGNRDIFIDNEAKVDAILKQLASVEAMALRTGRAIAIGHPYKETIAALKVWLPQAQEKGFLLVPVSAALQFQKRPKG